MKTLLTIIFLIAVIGGVVGYYRGWFHLSTQNEQGKTDVTLSVDKDKIEADKEKAVDKAQDVSRQAADKLKAATRSSRD